MERIAAGECITVPDDIYNKGCIHSMKDGLAAAIKIGFPVMIKASEGGEEKLRYTVQSRKFMVSQNQIFRVEM
jgi:acetyl-CoA carboxylase/biotin carboxylase 1